MTEDCNNGCLDAKKRDFITLAAQSMVGVGAVAFCVPLIHSMNPASDVLALSSVEVNVSGLEKGQSVKAMWRGKPVFIRRRTDTEVSAAKAVNISELRDPQSDADRVPADRPEWIVLIGICTHLGCIPLGESGEYGGWYCPCHGSHYDTSGRIRKGPAPLNMEVPPYKFTDDGVVVIG